MLFSELLKDSKFFDVDGIPVVLLPHSSAVAFEAGKGLDSPSRPWVNLSKLDEGDLLSRVEFAAWLESGFNRFDVRPADPANISYPGWVVLHVPHDSTDVPQAVRGQFLLDDKQLADELDRMTDHCTRALFVDPSSEALMVRAPVSCLVVDVERFASDVDEPMAARGMGAVYALTSGLEPLRRALSGNERDALMHEYYFPHHARLEAAVAASIERHGRCLVLDAHSFPDRPLPYEQAAADADRPDICIGTDPFHTSEALARAFVAELQRAGWRVAVNEPFAGGAGSEQSLRARPERRCRDGGNQSPALSRVRWPEGVIRIRRHRPAGQAVLQHGDRLS